MIEEPIISLTPEINNEEFESHHRQTLIVILQHLRKKIPKLPSSLSYHDHRCCSNKKYFSTCVNNSCCVVCLHHSNEDYELCRQMFHKFFLSYIFFL